MTAPSPAGATAVPPPGRHLWWLSFVDPARAAPRGEQVPGGPGFLGVCIIRASDMVSAVRTAHQLGCNPGGEVQGFGPLPVDGIDEKWWNRLLTAAETEEITDPWG